MLTRVVSFCDRFSQENGLVELIVTIKKSKNHYVYHYRAREINNSSVPFHLSLQRRNTKITTSIPCLTDAA